MSSALLLLPPLLPPPAFSFALLEGDGDPLRYNGRGEDSSYKHPVNEIPNLREHRDKTIPIYFHTDGGEVYNDNSYCIMHWVSALAHDIDPDICRFLFT